MIRLAAAALAVALLAVAGIGLWSWAAARAEAPSLAARADALIAAGRGPEALGAGRWAKVVAVQDPGFVRHSGVDLATDGAGITTITQSLAKRLHFDPFRPGWRKWPQTTYALGLEGRLSKDQIAGLWLDTVEMGRTPDGWAVGFAEAAQAIHGRPPEALDEPEFAALVARLIAPGRLSRPEGADELAERARRIERLWAGHCAPAGLGDVWLEGCA